MLKRTEKATFCIPSCRIDKEMFKSLNDLLKGVAPHYFLKSEGTDIEADDIELFIGSDWPPDISSIRIKNLDSDYNVDIFMNFRSKGKLASKVAVSGSDSLWVNGMAKALQKVFKKYQVWYAPIRRYWQVRLLMSVAIVFLVSWQVTHTLWKVATPPITGLTELQLYAIFFLLFTWFLYPLDLAILWLFPSFELANSRQKMIRKFFWFLLVLLIGWIITEFCFPQLLS